jgi:hypothetical protein
MKSRAPLYKRGNGELKVLQGGDAGGVVALPSGIEPLDEFDHHSLDVMDGLDPAIHGLSRGTTIVVALEKPGQDEFGEC